MRHQLGKTDPLSGRFEHSSAEVAGSHWTAPGCGEDAIIRLVVLEEGREPIHDIAGNDHRACLMGLGGPEDQLAAHVSFCFLDPNPAPLQVYSSDSECYRFSDPQA